MNIDIRSPQSMYVEMDEWTFYIDNSTGEQIVEKWKNDKSKTTRNYLQETKSGRARGADGEI